VTVLFTDLVGSTELSQRGSVEAADELRRGHFTVLRQAVAETGGTEVKNLGDGLMVVFNSASAALSCAVAMQQGVELDGRSRDVPLGIRVGLSAGEVTREDGDYFGDPVVEAARLCARCRRGQVLATDLVRLMAGRRNPHPSDPLGPVELKGLPEPVEVVEVRWEPLGGTEQSGLPGLLSESGEFPFAGRQKEAEALLRAYSTVAAGATLLVLVAGEPGIGKTRLTSQLAQEVLDTGALVLAGRSDELVGVPYQPFMEALRWLIAQPGGVRHLGPRAGELVRLVPELAHVVPDLPRPIVSSPEAERMALFEAVREWLGALRSNQPVLLVLDDLHWADMGSLLLLRHVVANDPVPGLLVVGTYRDTDLDRTRPLSNVLAEFHRRGDVERIVLGGLDTAEVTELLEKAAGHDLDEGARNLAVTLEADTGGNPFFVSEILRHLAESGAITQEAGRWVPAQDGRDPYLPEGIRQVIGRRVSVLPDETQRLLSSASVLGTQFDLDLLAAVSDVDADHVLDAIEPALSAHLVLEVGIGSYQFAHALVRSTLHGELSTTRRARLHLAVAQALETAHADDLDPVTADLAYHWGEVGAANLNDAAFAYAKRAAELAAARAAPDEAVRWYRIARERLDASDRLVDAELLCRLGQVEALVGELDWQTTLLEAARAAEAVGAVGLMAEALSVQMRTVFAMSSSAANIEKIELLERALELAADDPALAARILFALANEVLFTGDQERRAALYRQGMSLLDQVTDPLEWVRIISGQDASVPFSAVDARFMNEWRHQCSEALSLARSASDYESEYECLRTLCWISFWMGTEEGSFIDQIDQLLTAFPNPMFRVIGLIPKMLRSLKLGEFGAASEFAERLARDSAALGIPSAAYQTLSTLQQVRESRGLGVLADAMLGLPDLERERLSSVPGVSTALCAWALGEAGRLEEAAELVHVSQQRGFVDMPDDAGLPVTRVAWVEAAVLVGDRDACRALFDLLLPFHDIFETTGGWYAGSTARYLALLADALEQDVEADRWYIRAIEDHARAATPPWLARTRVDWAECLLRRGEAGRARELASVALSDMGELELTATRSRARAILDSTV
jgi:hypothetical protein